MLDQVFYGNSLQDWIISLIIIAAAFVLTQIIRFINRKIINSLSKKKHGNLAVIIIEAVQTPVFYGIILGAILIALARLNIADPKAHKYIFEAHKVLDILTVTWLIKNLVHALIGYSFSSAKSKSSKFNFDGHTISIIQKVIISLIWVIGIITALGAIGVKLGAILGTLGIGGMAFALAAQDTIKNIFGGFTILSDGTFRIGDRVLIDDTDGFVENIGIRSTRIRTLDKRMVIIPNYKIVDGAITNISDAPMFRVKMMLGLTYDTTPQQMNKAMEIAKNILIKDSRIDSESVFVTFASFGDFSLNIQLIYFVKGGENVLITPSDINMSLLEQYNEAGLNFAFPTQTLYIDKDTSVETVTAK